MTPHQILWITFFIMLGTALACDLWFNRHYEIIPFKVALVWTGIWLLLALSFAGMTHQLLGPERGFEFLTGYIIEQSLSVDNLFVFIMIFSYFGVQERFQTRVLKWGILGAVVLRLLFIVVGSALIEQFQWLFYIFGIILLYTAWKMAFGEDDEVELDKNPLVKVMRRILPMTKQIRGNWFFTKRQGIWIASPLCMVLVVIENSDLIFALDSIPAIFAITLDPMIVLTSNIFAILGLRSLFFLLTKVVTMFAHLKYGIALILMFVGIKMILIMHEIHIPILVSLSFILLTLVVTVMTSLMFASEEQPEI